MNEPAPQQMLLRLRSLSELWRDDGRIGEELVRRQQERTASDKYQRSDSKDPITYLIV
jgi:hypothetical protein